MNRRRSILCLALFATAASTLATQNAEGARRRTHGLVAVQVFHEPRPGRRVKAPTGTRVFLYDASRRRLAAVGTVNRYGVAAFSKMPLGSYYAVALGRGSQRATLRSSRLLLQVKF